MDKITLNKTSSSPAPGVKPVGTVPLTKSPELKPAAPSVTPAPAPPALSKPAPPPTPPVIPKPAPAPTRAVPAGKREANVELYQKQAKSVFIAGTFNNWNPEATPLQNSGTGKWLTTLLLAPGKYEYRFVVDGKWIEDPLAKESVPNPFGGLNSILVVKP